MEIFAILLILAGIAILVILKEPMGMFGVTLFFPMAGGSD